MIQDLVETLPLYMNGRANLHSLSHSALQVFQDIENVGLSPNNRVDAR